MLDFAFDVGEFFSGIVASLRSVLLVFFSATQKKQVGHKELNLSHNAEGHTKFHHLPVSCVLQSADLHC